MPKNAPKVRDAEVTRAFEHTYKDINELIMSVNGLSSKSNREGYKGKNGDMRLYRDLRTKQYFFEGRFDDGWAQVELDLAKKTNTTTVATSGDTNVQSDWNVSDNTSDAFIKNKPTVHYTSAIPSMGSGNSYAAGLTPAGSGTHSDTYLRKDGTWATPLNTTYSVMASGNSYAAGLTPAGSGTHSDTYLRKDGTWATPLNTTYSVMASGNSYAAGLVPAGSGTHNNTFLRKDGTWVAPSSGIALTDLSASAPITYDNSSGAFSVADHAVTLAKLPEIATARFLGRNTSGTGDIEVMTVTQVGALLSLDSYLTAVSQSDVTQHQGAIDHDQLTNFAANEHIDWTADQGSTNIHSGNYTDTNTMGAGFKIADGDSSHDVTEGHYLKIVTQSSGTAGVGVVSGDGGSGNPWIITLNAPNTTYSAMGSGNSYAAGLVPAGASSHNNTYLRKDGTWTLPSIHIQDDDGDSLTVDIDEHIKITGTGGITTDWTTDDAGGSGAPNILTIGLGSITQVGALSQGSIASGFTTIDEGFIDADIVRKNANTTITGIYTFSGKGIAINAGTAQDASGYDASLYISATSNNDWGIWVDKSSNNYGIKVDVASDASAAFGVYNDSTNKFMITGAGIVTWKDGGSANANTAYSWGDHGTEGYLKNITGQSISNLNDVNSISGISNGQVLVWNSTANAFQPGSSSYSWYLRDGDTTALEITSGKYVKLVEGTGIDIDFTDTDSGASDDEFDVTITNTLMTSGGTINGDVTMSGNRTLRVGGTGSETQSILVLGGSNSAGSRVALQANSDSSYLDCYGGEGSTERYRDFTYGARSHIFRTGAGSSLGTALTIDSSQNSIFTKLAYFKYGSSSNDNVRFYNQDDSYSYIRVTADSNNANTWFDTKLGSTTWFGWANSGGSGVSSWQFGTGNSTGANSVLISSGAIQIYNSGASVSTTLNANGSATFGGAVTFNASPVFSTGATGTLANRDGFSDFIGYNSNYGSYIGGGASNASRYIYAGGYFYDGSSVRTLIHSGNIGSQTVATATNADTLDSYHGSNYIGKNGNTYYRPNTWINMVDGGNAGLYWSSGSYAGWHLYPKDTGAFYIRSGNSNYCQVELSANGTVRGMVYADSSNNVGLLNEAGGWALQKVSGGSMVLHDNGGTTKLGSGDEWGRLEFNNYTNGTYVYLNQATFRVDADWNPYGNSVRDLGSNSLRWDNLWVNTIAQVGQLKLNNNFVWSQGGSDYGRFSSWLEGAGSNFVYFPNTGMTSSPHFYPVGSSWSYGTFIVSNGMSSWHGMTLSGHSSKPTYMHDSSHGGGGLYYQTTPRWAMYWDVGNDCMAIGSSTNSSSYWLYVHGAIYSTGDVVAFSDARVKTNVLTIDNALDKVLNMRGVYYNPIDKETKEVDDRRRVGVIAQELNEVLPEAVTYAEDVDEYGVDYGKLTGVLIEAIKELKQEINELKGS